MTILLNPGPVVVSDRVRNVLMKPDLCHREPEFIDLQNRIRAGLLDVYRLDDKDYASIVFTGSGTAAVEAMMTSLIPAHGKVLIIENGAYGERLTHIARIHGIDHDFMHHTWGAKPDLQRLEGELRYHQALTHVAIVQHETTTGRLNDIGAVAKLCKQYGDVPLLIDSVSSFGAEEIKFDEWNVAACAATANKCLHGVPGTSFVIAKRDAIAQLSTPPARTLYLDLLTYLKNQDVNDTPFTPSIQTFYALAEALDELKDRGGWQQRQTEYRHRMDRVRDGLAKLGIAPYLDKEACSCVLNAFHLPGGMGYQALHDKLKGAGFVIYAGQGILAKSLFRVSCMGTMTNKDVARFIKAMKKIVN